MFFKEEIKRFFIVADQLEHDNASKTRGIH